MTGAGNGRRVGVGVRREGAFKERLGLVPGNRGRGGPELRVLGVSSKPSDRRLGAEHAALGARSRSASLIINEAGGTTPVCCPGCCLSAGDAGCGGSSTKR